MPPERPGPTAHTVDPDPLAATRPIGPGSLDRDLEDIVADPALDPRKVVTPADQLTIGARAMGPPPAEQRDGLEQAGLAGGVRPPDQLGAGPERGVE